MSVEPTTHPRTQRSRLERVARLVVLALILAGVLVALLVSLHRAFQVDEVEHMHAGYHVASGRLPYVEFWQLHDPLLYGMLGPITDPGDPRASYRRGRALMLLLLVGTAGAAAAAAGRLAGREGAALAAGLLLLHTTFVERGIEVRPDGLAAFLATLALALELGPRAERPAVGFARGALLALAVLATKKSLFVVGLFGLWWLARAGGRRRLAPLTPILGLLATAAVASFAMLALGNLEPYLRATWLTSAEAVGGSEVWVPFGPWGFLVREGARNLAFVVVAASGWIACLALAVGERAEDRRLLFPALLAAGAVASLWLQPFPWPYVHLGALPPVAVAAAAGSLRALARADRRLARRPWSALAAVLILAAAGAAPRLLAKAAGDPGPTGQARQLALLDEVQRATGPEDPVFDMAGLYFRPDGYPAYALSSDLLRLVRAGGLPPLIDELRARGVVALVVNYRVDWLQGEEREFLARRFVQLTDNLFVLGAELSGEPAGVDLPWEALAARSFRWEGPPGVLEVDGRPFSQGALARGAHTLRLREPVADGRLILETPEPVPPRRPSSPMYPQFD